MTPDEVRYVSLHELTTDEDGHIRGRSGLAREHERWLLWESGESGLCPEEIKSSRGL